MKATLKNILTINKHFFFFFFSSKRTEYFSASDFLAVRCVWFICFHNTRHMRVVSRKKKVVKEIEQEQAREKVECKFVPFGNDATSGIVNWISFNFFLFSFIHFHRTMSDERKTFPRTTARTFFCSFHWLVSSSWLSAFFVGSINFYHGFFFLLLPQATNFSWKQIRLLCHFDLMTDL